MACVTLKRPLETDPLYSPGGRPSKRRRFAMTGSPSSPHCSPIPTKPESPFSSVVPRMTPEQISSRMKDEIRQLRKLKQFNFLDKDSGATGSAGPASPSSNSDEGSSDSVYNSSTSQKTSKSSDKDQPIFTFRQVELICERVLKDQEEKIRREYDQVLTCKLAEQYDMFVKFTHDQIQKRFEAASAPSYLS